MPTRCWRTSNWSRPCTRLWQKRSPKSRTRGRRGTPAEVVMRLLLLKHIRNWSYDVLEREVRANLVYRDFTRGGASKAPDSKTMGRWGLALGPETVEKIHERVVEIAQGNQVVKGRKMRLDTTVVETNSHYPSALARSDPPVLSKSDPGILS